MSDHAWTTYHSPLGPLTLFASPRGIVGLQFPGRRSTVREVDRSRDTFAEAVGQPDEYFAGRRRAFELQLDLSGTQFQLRVWHQLQLVAYGTTISYTRV